MESDDIFIPKLSNAVLVYAQNKIEKMYQRAMDLRDSTPTPENADELEEAYTSAYLLMHRLGDVDAFRGATIEYLRHFTGNKKESTDAD